MRINTEVLKVQMGTHCLHPAPFTARFEGALVA